MWRRSTKNVLSQGLVSFYTLFDISLKSTLDERHKFSSLPWIQYNRREIVSESQQSINWGTTRTDEIIHSLWSYEYNFIQNQSRKIFSTGRSLCPKHTHNRNRKYVNNDEILMQKMSIMKHSNLIQCKITYIYYREYILVIYVNDTDPYE